MWARLVPALIAATALAVGAIGGASASPSSHAVADGRALEPAPRLAAAALRPNKAYFAGPTLRIYLRPRGREHRRLRLEVVSRANGRVVSAWKLGRNPGPVRRRWRGLRPSGRLAHEGRYVARVRAAGSRSRRIARFRWRRHAYPVDGPHYDRGPAGEFGVPRNGGRTHDGYDVMAPCGTPLVAARGGKVVKSAFDPRLYGHYLVVRGKRDRLHYVYVHLRSASPHARGDRVRTGERLGAVGATGNAASVGCHLHFELRRNGRPLDPAPRLAAWED